MLDANTVGTASRCARTWATWRRDSATRTAREAASAARKSSVKRMEVTARLDSKCRYGENPARTLCGRMYGVFYANPFYANPLRQFHTPVRFSHSLRQIA